MWVQKKWEGGIGDRMGVVVLGMATPMSLTEQAIQAVDRLFELPYHEEDAALCLRQVREHIDDLLEALLLKTKPKSKGKALRY